MKPIYICKKIAARIIKAGYGILSGVHPVDEHMAMFISFHGKGYSDSPRAIYEEMSRDKRFSGWKYIWVLNGKKKEEVQRSGIRAVDYLSPAYFYYLSKAKYWIFNCKMPEYIRKKKKQIYLQTWHGTPLKRLGHDIIAAENASFYRTGLSFEKMAESYDVDSARYDYMVSPNSFSTEVFQTAFHVKKEKLIETGYPRNDFIVNAGAEECMKIKRKYGIPTEKKVVLYAPTWRDNSYDLKGYVFQLQADFYKWKAVLGEDYVLLFKPHYLIVNKYLEDDGLRGFLYHIPAEKDINELYVISDILITDYSSVFFDYAILQRPVYFYMYDLVEYREELRGFYLDIYTELPGDIYEDETEMLQAIKNGMFNYERLKAFNQRFNAFHTGDSAKKVIDILVKGSQI